jgi:hypothetical protein
VLAERSLQALNRSTLEYTAMTRRLRRHLVALAITAFNVAIIVATAEPVHPVDASIAQPAIVAPAGPAVAQADAAFAAAGAL